jgi:hypothetical protein
MARKIFAFVFFGLLVCGSGHFADSKRPLEGFAQIASIILVKADKEDGSWRVQPTVIVVHSNL